MATQNELSLRRVVVALDATADFAPVIEMAAAMAVGLGTRLSALFVEDESLRRLASLPFAQQVDPVTALRSSFDAAGLRAQSVVLERRMRRELERVAGLHDLSWSFETLQATIGPEALQLTEDELLVVAATTRPVASGLRVGSAWRRAIGQVRHPLLLVPERPEATGPVAALYEATEAGRRALATSRRIARAGKRPLIVIVSEEATPERQSEIEALVRKDDDEVTVRVLRPASHGALRELVVSSHTTLLVVGRDGMATTEIADLLRLSISSALMVV